MLYEYCEEYIYMFKNWFQAMLLDNDFNLKKPEYTYMYMYQKTLFDRLRTSK